MKTYPESITYLQGLEPAIGTELQAEINDALNKAIDEEAPIDDRQDAITTLATIFNENPDTFPSDELTAEAINVVAAHVDTVDPTPKGASGVLYPRA